MFNGVGLKRRNQGSVQGEGEGGHGTRDEFGFILSKSRFRDRNATFIENPRGTASGKFFFGSITFFGLNPKAGMRIAMSKTN